MGLQQPDEILILSDDDSICRSGSLEDRAVLRIPKPELGNGIGLKAKMLPQPGSQMR